MIVPAPLVGGSLLDPTGLLSGVGPWALVILFVIIFIESGLLFPFLPGDSLLFAAGTLHLVIGVPIPVLVAVAFAAAFLGDQVGYWLGSRFGRRLFTDDARVLKTKHLAEAEAFFDKYGGRAIVLARFVPIVRTCAPVAAGMSRMSYRHFVSYNVIGALVWAVGVTMLGFALGNLTFVKENIEALVVLIVFVSVLPMVIEIWRARREAKKAPAEAILDVATGQALLADPTPSDETKS